MADGDLVLFALGAFALVEGFEFQIVLRAIESRLEESGAQDFHAAFAHFGVTFPLAALAQTRVVAHEGLESGGHLAMTPRVQELVRQVSQHFGYGGWAKARHRFDQRFGVRFYALAQELINLPVDLAQTRFHFASRSEGWLARPARWPQPVRGRRWSQPPRL